MTAGWYSSSAGNKSLDLLDNDDQFRLSLLQKSLITKDLIKPNIQKLSFRRSAVAI